MNKTGKVIQTENEYAVVSVPRETACGENCKGCMGCEISNIEVKVLNEPKADIGDFVLILFSDDVPLLLAFYVFLLPIIAVFGGYFVGKALFGVAFGITISVLCSGGWAYLLYYKNKKHSRKLPDGKIVEIISKNELC